MACSAPPSPDPPSWEAFQQRAARVVDGHTIYVVEWDLALTLGELRDYYERNVAHPDIGFVGQDSTVNQVSGHDDIWTSDAQRRLTYCITDDFGTLKSRVISEMAAATAPMSAAAAARGSTARSARGPASAPSPCGRRTTAMASAGTRAPNTTRRSGSPT